MSSTRPRSGPGWTAARGPTGPIAFAPKPATGRPIPKPSSQSAPRVGRCARSSDMNAVVETQKPSLLAKFAGKFGVEANKMMTTLKQTAFRQRDGSEVSNEQMMALLIVADQYGLNPFTKE